MFEGRYCSSCFWASARHRDTTEGTEHVQNGCYINMFTGLAQCGTLSSFNMTSSWKWGIFGDQMTMTYRGATKQRNSLHVPTCWKWKWRGRTHRLSAAGRGHKTGTVYTVSICIWRFVKPFIRLLIKSPLLFSYPNKYNTICHLVTVEPDG